MATGTLNRIKEIAKADLLVLTGDLTNFGSRLEVRRVLDDCLRVNPRVLAQYGNLDLPEVNQYLEDLDINLHGQARLVNKELCLVGIGGSNITPFHTPSEFSEKELSRIGIGAFEQASEFISLSEPLHLKKIPLVLISHTPPYATKVDRLRSGRHVGSKAIRQLIEHYQPQLCICGHIHESRGEDVLGQTRIYNPGMLCQYGWVHLVLENSHISATLS